MYPEFKRKIMEFYHGNNEESERLIVKHFDKRTRKRFQISGFAAAKFLNSYGIPIGEPFRGQMIDISNGGFSFQMNMKKESNANVLLGKRIVSIIRTDKKISIDDMFWGGVIVDVCKKKDRVFSIHLKGDDASNKITEALRHLQIYNYGYI